MHFGQINLSTSKLQIKRHWDEMGLFNFLLNNGLCKPTLPPQSKRWVETIDRNKKQAPNSGSACWKSPLASHKASQAVQMAARGPEDSTSPEK